MSKVNISLNEFQRLSIGEHNAGEVKLAGETKLAKMNNHVGSFFVNNEIIAHEEVIAIKQALVNALSQNGVGEDALNKIRKDLGLSTVDSSDRDLRHRSIMPLTRQKIREILDQNAATINSFNVENGGNVRIRTSNQIYSPAGMDEARAAKRDAVALIMAQFAAVDRLELPPRTADAIKETLVGLEKFGNIDLPRLVDETEKNIDLRKLEGLLRTNASTDLILDAMAEVSRAMFNTTLQLIPGKWGADERTGLLAIIRTLAVRAIPDMANLLDAFFSRPDVKNTIQEGDNEAKGWQAMSIFRTYSSDPELCLDGQYHAETAYSLFAEPREIAAFTNGNGMIISGDAATPIASLVLKGSGVRGTENPGLEIKTRINRVAKSIMQTAVAEAIGDELRRDNHNKRIDHFNFERPGMQFELDLARKVKVRFGGGEAISEDDFEGARDRFVKFLTNDANATYAGADDRTKLKAQVLMTHASQVFLCSSQLSIGLAFHPEGKTGRINMNRNPDGGVMDLSIDISRDDDGNIVIGGDLTYRAPVIMMTTSGPEYEAKTATGDSDSYARHHLDVVIADADLDKFVNAEWDGFNYAPIHDVDLDNNMPHHNEVAADMLQGDHKLEYRKFDVSYDFHVNKLYEFDPPPGVPPREITL